MAQQISLTMAQIAAHRKGRAFFNAHSNMVPEPQLYRDYPQLVDQADNLQDSSPVLAGIYHRLACEQIIGASTLIDDND